MFRILNSLKAGYGQKILQNILAWGEMKKGESNNSENYFPK